MAMESGLGDYNDAQLQAWTFANPDSDYSPFDFIGNLSKYGNLGQTFASFDHFRTHFLTHCPAPLKCTTDCGS